MTTRTRRTVENTLLFDDEIAAVKRLFTRLRARETRWAALGSLIATIALTIAAVVAFLLFGALWIVLLCGLGVFVAIGWGLRY